MASAGARRPGAVGGPAVVQLGPGRRAARGALVDAMEDPAAARALLAVLSRTGGTRRGTAEIVASTVPGDVPLSEADVQRRAAEARPRARPHDAALRRSLRAQARAPARGGVSPELEIGRVPRRARRPRSRPPCAARSSFAAPARADDRRRPARLRPERRARPGSSRTGARALLRARPGAQPRRAAARRPGAESPLRLAGREPPPVVREMIGELPRHGRPARRAHRRAAPASWRRATAIRRSRPSRTRRSTGGRSTSRCATSAAGCCARCANGCRCSSPRAQREADAILPARRTSGPVVRAAPARQDDAPRDPRARQPAPRPRPLHRARTSSSPTSTAFAR